MEKTKPEGSILLDDPTIRRRAEHLPEEMREPYIWTGVYLREACSRDLHTLTSRFVRAGIQHDVTTWSAIMRGHWDTMPNGLKRPSPKLSVEKFLAAVKALREDVRRREQAGQLPFQMTTTARQIIDYIEPLRSPTWVCKFGVVIGETGGQKTATFKHYCRENNHGQCVWLEASHSGSITQFTSDLAIRYGASDQLSQYRKLDAIRRSIAPKEDGSGESSKLIIVDNVQRLYDSQRGGDQPVFNMLQKLNDETGVAVLLSFTPTFYQAFTAGVAKGYFEQFVGRAGGTDNFLRLPEYAPTEDVLQFARAFGLPDPEDHEDLLVSISRRPGRIRTFFNVMQTAKALAGKRQLSIDDIHRVETRRIKD